jgi:hypothetical protein
MIFLCGKNIWNYEYTSTIGIPTNGYIAKNGSGVMGRGLALQAKNRYKGIERNLGDLIKTQGNVVGYIWKNPNILAIPVKPSHLLIETTEDFKQVLPRVRNLYDIGFVVPGFHCRASIDIIERSLQQLILFITEHNISSVHIPMLGCGNGDLSPSKDFAPLLKKMKLPNSISLIYT